MPEAEITRLTIVWSKGTDLALRSHLGRQGRKKGALSKFVEDAVKWRLFDQTVNQAREAFASVPAANFATPSTMPSRTFANKSVGSSVAIRESDGCDSHWTRTYLSALFCRPPHRPRNSLLFGATAPSTLLLRPSKSPKSHALRGIQKFAPGLLPRFPGGWSINFKSWRSLSRNCRRSIAHPILTTIIFLRSPRPERLNS